MSFYEQGFASVAAAANAAYASVAGATTRDARVREIGAFCTAATASSINVCRPANTPVATGPVVGNATNPDGQVASIVSTASVWSTPPTLGVVFRRIVLPATIGAGIVFVWNPGEELWLSKTAGTTQWALLWNFGAGAGSILACYAKWDE